jgi:hypothetical protein
MHKPPADYPIFWHKADIRLSSGNVRFWHKADIRLSSGNVRFRG